jgi:hypothetical protein
MLARHKEVEAMRIHTIAARSILTASVVGLVVALMASPAYAGTSAVTVTIQSPASGATVFGTISVSGTASAKAGISSVSVAADSGSYQPASRTNGGTGWAYSLNTNNLTNGAHTITARAVDSHGRSATSSVGVNVNNTPPTITISTPKAGAFASGNVSVAGTAASQAGIAGVQVRVDSSTWAPASGTSAWNALVASSNYADGAHTISAMAADSVGHSSTATISVTFSNSPPTVSITTPQAGATVAGSVTVSGSAASLAGIASVQVQVDSSGWTIASGTTSWTTGIVSAGYADGPHTIYAMATDTVGRSSTTSITVTFSNSPPTISISSPQPGTTISATIAVSGSAASPAGIASVQVQVDSNAWVTATGTTSWTLSINTTAYSNGPHTISAMATDTFGRSSAASISITVSNLIQTHQSPWYLIDGTGGVSTVNETMTWDGDTNFNSKLPSATVTFQVNSTIGPNDANANDACSQDAGTGYWSCVHQIQSADLQWNSVIGWSLHYAFQLQVEYPPADTFTISYSGDSNFASSSAPAINT